MTVGDAQKIIDRMAKLNVKDMTVEDQNKYMDLLVKWAELVKPIADKYVPEKKPPKAAYYSLKDGKVEKIGEE